MQKIKARTWEQFLEHEKMQAETQKAAEEAVVLAKGLGWQPPQKGDEMTDEPTKSTENPTDELQLEGNPAHWQTNYNMREWVREALEAKGAKCIGAGCGGCQSDLDIELEGMKYNIQIRPLPK